MADVNRPCDETKLKNIEWGDLEFRGNYETENEGENDRLLQNDIQLVNN